VSTLLKKEKGFTLIEIVLVLAIAGLLLVIVFLAVSGAQKSRRDTQRKNDLSRIAAQLESYASNQNGIYPTAVQFSAVAAGPLNFWGTYVLSGNYNDPTSGTVYTPGNWNAAPVFPVNGPALVTYRVGTACDGTVIGRGYSVNISLEQGVACRDNK
jgi:prepilin-type N-terminal cleavage/methylation domain-containing protein